LEYLSFCRSSKSFNNEEGVIVSSLMPVQISEDVNDKSLLHNCGIVVTAAENYEDTTSETSERLFIYSKRLNISS